jgi:anti-anti-sigma factor
VSPQGRIDSNAAPELETVLMNLLNQGHISLVLNMESVSYISSRGLKTCITVWQRVSERGGNLRLCGVIPHVHTIIETVGFTEILEIYGTVKQAVDAFAKDEKR